MKLLEVNATKDFASTFLNDIFFKMAVNRVLDAAPGFDLVRCKECKHYDKDGEFCKFWQGVRHPEHYCGEGERKDND